MARRPSTRGNFTRACIETVFAGSAIGRESRTAALHLSVFSDPGVRRLHAEWVAGRLERHRATDGAPAPKVVRLAVVGVWQPYLTHAAGGPLPNPMALHGRPWRWHRRTDGISTTPAHST